MTIELVVQRTHPEDRSAVQQLIERVSRERKDFDFEHRLLMPDGSVKYVRVVGHPSTNQSGSFEFVGAVTDITERKRAETLFIGEKRLFEMIATGVALKEILNVLCLIIEEYQSRYACLCFVASSRRSSSGIRSHTASLKDGRSRWKSCQLDQVPALAGRRHIGDHRS